MFNKRAQGLPINTIILIAVGLLILVLFIVFVTGGFSALSPATNSTSQAMQAFGSQCTTQCSEATPGQTPFSFCSSTTVISGKTYSCSNQTSAQQWCEVSSEYYYVSGSSPSGLPSPSTSCS